MEMESYLDLAVVSIREGLDYYNVSIFTLDEDRSQLQLASHAGAYRGRVSKGFRQDIGVGMLGWVVRNGEMRLANDVSREPHYLAIEGLATASEICLPIMIEGQIEGVLNVESDRVDATMKATSSRSRPSHSRSRMAFRSGVKTKRSTAFVPRRTIGTGSATCWAEVPACVTFLS